MKQIKIQVMVPDAIHKAFKAEATCHSRTMNVHLRELLNERYANVASPRPTRIRKGERI